MFDCLFSYKSYCYWQARSQGSIFFGGGGGGSVWGPLESVPVGPNPILAHFVAKSGPFGRFGGFITPLWLPACLIGVTMHSLLKQQRASQYSYSTGPQKFVRIKLN